MPAVLTTEFTPLQKGCTVIPDLHMYHFIPKITVGNNYPWSKAAKMRFLSPEMVTNI